MTPEARAELARQKIGLDPGIKSEAFRRYVVAVIKDAEMAERKRCARIAYDAGAVDLREKILFPED